MNLWVRTRCHEALANVLDLGSWNRLAADVDVSQERSADQVDDKELFDCFSKQEYQDPWTRAHRWPSPPNDSSYMAIPRG